MKIHLGYTILIGAILFVAGYFTSCKKDGDIVVDGKKYEVIKTETKTVVKHDTSYVYKKGKDIYHSATIYIPIKDSSTIPTIAQECNNINVFSDTILSDSGDVRVFINDSLQKNKILGRKAVIESKLKTIYNTTYLSPVEETSYLVGATVGTNGIGPNFSILTKKKHTIGVGTGINVVNRAVLPFINVGIQFKIK